jgi:hypothetical protein
MDKYKTMMTRFLAETQPDMFQATSNPDIYDAVVSPQKIKGFQNYIDRLRMQDEQKMEDLAVERAVVSQGMLQVKQETQRDTGGRNKAVNIESIKTSEKPGYTMAEGSNFWSVNTDDPYWDTEEGYQEALNLYGESPAWSTRPMEQDNQFVDLQPTKRISL